MSASLVSKTIEISVSDQDFDYYRKLLTRQSRRNTEPLPNAMARDSMSGYSGQSRRSSSYSIAQSTTSRSRIPGGGSRASQASMPLDEGYQSCASGSPSEYAASNVTGCRRTLDVPGLPGPSYFNSGASLYDRRPQYVGRPPSAPQRSQSSTAGQGQELVRYNSGPQSTSDQQLVRYSDDKQPAFEDPDDYSDNENNTVVPSDSISNVSSRRHAPPNPSRPSYASRRSRAEEVPRPMSYRRSYSYANGEGSAYGGSRCSDRPPIQYRIIERRPGVC